MDGIRKIFSVIALAAVMLAFTAPTVAQVANIPVEKSNKDMAATISGMNDASMANTMIKAAEIDKTMASGSHTVFIPSDSAIKGTGIDLNTVYGVLSNKPLATKMMRGLVMDGSIMPSDMANGKGLTMINGQTMFISDTNGQVALDGVRITRAVQTTNGMVYVLDSIPSSMLQNVKSTTGMLA